MFTTESAADLLARAEMHERLAGATGDIPARKMHQAMAVEYRRKASETGGAPMATDPVLKLKAVMG